MKLSLIIGLASMAGGVVSSLGQGQLILDNYFIPIDARVTYGSSDIPRNGISGTTAIQGAGLSQDWVVGFYWVAGTAAIGADPNLVPVGDPSTFGGGLSLATGVGSTVNITIYLDGEFYSGQRYTVPGVGAGGTITMEMVAYTTASGSYAASLYRGHSAPFTMTLSDPSDNNPNKVGNFMSPFSVFAIPEPSIFALAGLTAAAAVFLARQK